MEPLVLFVDDDHNVTAALSVSLRRQPYRALTCNSPREALDILGRESVDIIVADDHMPEMSGNDLLAKVRAVSPATMRIMLTGSGTLDSAMEAINSGAVFRYLLKPCSRDALLTCLSDASVAQRHHKRILDAEGETLAQREVSRQYERAVEQMWLAVQPIVRLSKHDCAAQEVLVRTREPTVPHGGAFIALGEQAGRIRELDRRIRADAARLAATLPGDSLLFVNLHPTSFDDPWFATDRDPLTRVARRVVLEVSEGTSPGQLDRARDRLAAARRAGYRIALDDVGAGEAGLGVLASLQPDYAKLDRGLVQDVDADVVRGKVARGLAALCRELDVQVIAEGVETEGEFRFLRGCGFDLFQGYYFARPGPPWPAVRWPPDLTLQKTSTMQF